MARLFKTSIYVNASSERVRAASRGTEPSQPIVENKRWATGVKLLKVARERGEELPLVFSYYRDLTFWAVASDIRVHEETTEYRFRDLRPLRGHRRSHLIVESTGSSLPDDFIRSYALVRTPGFLGAHQSRKRRQASARSSARKTAN